MLRWSWAGEADSQEFAEFECSHGESAPAWVREAELYVRHWVIREAQYVLAHRDEAGDLVAVSAFDRTTIGLPLLAPTDRPGWHLQVVAIALRERGRGTSAEVFANTFSAMRQVDASRVFVTANVHREHAASQRACSNAGLTPWIPKDDEYWILLGEVPEG